MKAFAALYDELDRTVSTSAKVDALARYFRNAPAGDAAWATALLLGRRPKRLVKAPDLRRWAAELAEIPDWLFEECYAQVGDLAETIDLLVPESAAPGDASLLTVVETQVLPLPSLPPDAQRATLRSAWSTLGGTARFVFTKLITGAFRVGVSDGLVVRALAQTSGASTETIAHRLMGQWEPSAEWYERVISSESTDADWSQPYPFFLAYPLTDAPSTLGDVADWQCEWKWDGIRAQLVRRRGRTFLWSRGEELLVGRFPEIDAAAEWLPDGTVLDGELLAWGDGVPRPFSDLQRRLNRKVVGKKLLEEVPCHLLTYDCIEHDGADIRSTSLRERRELLERVVRSLPGGAPIGLSPLIAASDWDAVATAQANAREVMAEGLMLKRLSSAYGVGRRTGDWWKWKVEPLTIDAVLVYAQAGRGRRAGLYTDYTFAVWDGATLVPLAKAYSGLTDAEIKEVDAFIRRNTLEKFGPVRTVKPDLVFELAFEGIQVSNRHKSGIAVRFPRIARWRTDKIAAQADTLETVRALLANVASTGNT